MNKIVHVLFRYFLNGLLLVLPVSATVYLIMVMIEWTDGLLPIDFPGVGLVTVVAATTILGYLANTMLIRPLINLFNGALKRIPIISFIYSSINDLVTAFVGEKNKFDSPVLVPFDEHGILYKPGFITQKDLSEIGLPGKVTVYLPHSYNFSGNVFIVDKSKLIPLEGNNTSIMKYIVSGGISGKFRVKK